MLYLSVIAATNRAQDLIQELLCPPRSGFATSVGQFVEDTFPAMSNTLCTWRSTALAKRRTDVRRA